jgi:NAD(P)-dependent dehydrogenase (short-subunit alcohol dehydrogenase family)
MSELFRLDGRTALVTGASRGIGRAIAIELARAGADVAVLARDTAKLKEVADEIDRLGRRAPVLPCNVNNYDEISDAVAAALAEFGQLDIAVNNAGGFSHVGPFLEMELQDWTAILRTNLESVVHFCREVGRHMTARGSGSLINVASVGGYNGVPMLSMYAVAKAGVISLTRTLAVEWARSGVRVNVLAPGWTRTDLTSSFAANPQLCAEMLRNVPSDQWCEPHDMAGTAVYLASDAARMVTGTCATVDAGVTAHNTGPALIDLLGAGRIPV